MLPGGHNPKATAWRPPEQPPPPPPRPRPRPRLCLLSLVLVLPCIFAGKPTRFVCRWHELIKANSFSSCWTSDPLRTSAFWPRIGFGLPKSSAVVKQMISQGELIYSAFDLLFFFFFQLPPGLVVDYNAFNPLKVFHLEHADTSTWFLFINSSDDEVGYSSNFSNRINISMAVALFWHRLVQPLSFVAQHHLTAPPFWSRWNCKRD